MKKWFAVLAVVVLALVISGVAMAQDAPSGELEIFSWWTGGGEAAGLDVLIAKFAELYPDVSVVNAAVAGGSGVNARAVLTTRMLGGDPPDTFQVHAGEELNAVWVAAHAVEPLNSIYEANGWMEQFPQGLLDLLTDAEGNIYAVPVNIHRSNVMWYIPANLEQWGVTVPTSWDEFVNVNMPGAAGRWRRRWPLAKTGRRFTCGRAWPSACLAQMPTTDCGTARRSWRKAPKCRACRTPS